jgi:serine/threonine protein phosphatase PrpC
MSDSETNTTPAAGDPPEIVVRVFGRTDVGLIREHNEDNFLIADLTNANRSILPEVRTHRIGPRGSVFTVCDGMGGAAAGEVASRIGIDTIYEILQGGEQPVGDVGLAQRLDTAICEAGTRIFTAAKLNRGQRGMGTTVTAAALSGPRLVIGQVGDSRAHIVRRGALVQVTKDQSLVQQLIDAKQLTHEEAKAFDRSNIILQALGTTEEVHVDMTSVALRRGDALVMCSDGLSGRVDSETICRIVVETDEPMDACRRLTELACENGGDDNITVIVARFDGAGLPECGENDVVAYERFEYRQVTETTARAPLSRFVKDAEADKVSDAVPSAATAPEPAPEPEPEVEPEQKPAPEVSVEAVAKSPEAAAPAAQKAESVPPKAVTPEPAPKGGKRRSKAVFGVLIAVIACAGIGYLLTRGGGDAGGGDEAAGSQSPTNASPAAQAPLASPASALPVPRVAPPVEEPRLAPVAEERILGTGEDAAAGAPPKGGSGGAVEASKKKDGDGEKKADAPAPKKKKKAETAIEENPY